MKSGNQVSVDHKTRAELGSRRTIGTASAFICLAVLTIATAALRAEDQREVQGNASFTVGSSSGDGDTALATALGMGLRLPSRLGIDLELSHARALDFIIDLCPQPRVCVIGGRLPVTGRTLSLVPHLTAHLLPRSNRGTVYAVAGAGVGHIRQHYFVVPAFIGGERPEFTRSSLIPVVSFGGGATFSVGRGFSAGIDVRSLHLLDDEVDESRFITPAGTLSTVRVGARLVYRF